MGDTDVVEEASGADAEVEVEVDMEEEVGVKDEVELGELAVRPVDRAPIEGTKGIPAPLSTPHSQS